MSESAAELLNDMRRLQKSLNNKRVRRKNESRDDYIKRKAGYKCCYCHKDFARKNLNASLEPFHIIKAKETLETVLEYYRISEEEFFKLNPEYSKQDIQQGVLLRVPQYFKIFPNTHGVCYCNKCGSQRKTLGADHVSFIKHLLKKRRSIREEITPELRRKIYKRDKYKCVYCEIEYGRTKPNTYLTLDHKNPVVGGGDNREENLCTSCDFHNHEKDKDSYDTYVKKIKKRKHYREYGLLPVKHS